MIIPANAAAEQVKRLTEINGDIDKQIEQLQLTQAKNVENISAFEAIAEWVELPDPEPQTAAEVEIPPLDAPPAQLAELQPPVEEKP